MSETVSGDGFEPGSPADSGLGSDLPGRVSDVASGTTSEVAPDTAPGGTDPALASAEQSAAAPAVARWVGFVYTAGGIALVPWTIYLAVSLPRTSHSAHYRMAWVGFDILLAFMLLRVGWIAARPKTSDRVELPATSAGTLLLVDAWFDTTTSADTGALVAALVLAVVAELPMAAICFWIAHHAEEIRERRLQLLPVLEQRVAQG
jgi:hypothetical protein